MKKICLILLITLTICSAIEERFDDNLVLEVSKGKAIASTKATYPTRDAIGITTRITSKVKNVRNLPIKGINDILKGKSGKKLKKQDIVKNRNASQNEKNLSYTRHAPPKPKTMFCSRNPGQRYNYKKNGS